MGDIAIILFGLIFLLTLAGYPVAFTLGGASILCGLLLFDSGADFFYLLVLRTFGTMNNFILISVPLFVFMGVMLEKSGIAERLLEAMAFLCGRMRGGLAISVVAVGALLAASTGVVGATVVTMGLISLPVMLKKGYSTALATGTIASSGTLGQIIPPSVVLVLLGSVLNVSVGGLFTAAVVPGLLLVVAYIVYILVYARLYPAKAPALSDQELEEYMAVGIVSRLLKAFVMPMLLVLGVLGSIFTGLASPTESAALGAAGAAAMTAWQGRLDRRMLRQVMQETAHITAMVFMILIGAAAFGLVFRGMEGDRYIIALVQSADLHPYAFLALVMLVVFVAGFFIDFIEIIFIIVPVVAPAFKAMGLDLTWIGILLAVNLQTSFVTPPFGFALFYLKGVAPPEVRTTDLYRGIIPFVLIQLAVVALIIFYPELIRLW